MLNCMGYSGRSDSRAINDSDGRARRRKTAKRSQRHAVWVLPICTVVMKAMRSLAVVVDRLPAPTSLKPPNESKPRRTEPFWDRDLAGAGNSAGSIPPEIAYRALGSARITSPSPPFARWGKTRNEIGMTVQLVQHQNLTGPAFASEDHAVLHSQRIGVRLAFPNAPKMIHRERRRS
jgi:hypothetical protein